MTPRVPSPTFLLTMVDGTEHHVTILPIDQLDAEEAWMRAGVTPGDAQVGLRYCHHAALRLGISTTADFRGFVAELAAPVTSVVRDPGEPEPGPTRIKRAV